MPPEARRPGPIGPLRGGRREQTPKSLPDRCPLPRATVEAFGRVRHSPPDRVQLHPIYPLLKMIQWHDGWSDKAPHGSDALSPTVKRQAFDAGRTILNGDPLKGLAGHVSNRRRAWVDPLVVAGLARVLRLTALTDVVVHLSSPGPLELGMALHHVYGFPVLPATSLKGLAHAAAGGNHPEVYGTQDRAGFVDVLEGLPARWEVQRDVMTPHFAKWYRDGHMMPDDTESPIPISFLSLKPGSIFDVVLLAPRAGAGAQAAIDAFEHDLTLGIDERGFGAKTAAGYGVFRVERVAVPTVAKPTADANTGPAAPPAAPVTIETAFERRMKEVGALPGGDPGRLSGSVDWFLKLEDPSERATAARMIVEKAGRKWVVRKAKDNERWARVLAATGE